jgi:hypothetical protein
MNLIIRGEKASVWSSFVNLAKVVTIWTLMC